MLFNDDNELRASDPNFSQQKGFETIITSSNMGRDGKLNYFMLARLSYGKGCNSTKMHYILIEHPKLVARLRSK